MEFMIPMHPTTQVELRYLFGDVPITTNLLLEIRISRPGAFVEVKMADIANFLDLVVASKDGDTRSDTVMEAWYKTFLVRVENCGG